MSSNNTIPTQFEQIVDDMTAGTLQKGTSRRGFLKGSGLLMVSFSVAGLAKAETRPGAAATVDAVANGTEAVSLLQAAGPYLNPGPDPKQLDSFVAISVDGRATFFSGKVDNGQGLSTAFRQFVSDELDIAYENTRVIFGDTSLTVDQNGMSGTTAVEQAGPPLRNACAEARRVLLGLAAAKLGVTVDQLNVGNGVISLKSDATKRATYGELIGGKTFNTSLTWNGSYGNGLSVAGIAKPKSVNDFKVVGQSITSDEIAAKATATFTYTVDVKVPGMVHARTMKPPVAGAKLISVDESSVSKLPGFVKVVTNGNYLAIVFEREDQVISALAQLKATWQNPSTASFPPSDQLYDYLKKTPSISNPNPTVKGNVDTALASAAKTVTAEYHFPYQAHCSMGPAAAVADPSNGLMTVWSGTQKPYAQRRTVSSFLGYPMEKCKVIWVEGPGSYGRNDAGDVGIEAAYIAQKLNRPVRMQWMRSDTTAWDPKGPALVATMRGGFDAQNNMIAYDFDSIWGSGNQISAAEDAGLETLIGQFSGLTRPAPSTGNTGTPNFLYNFPNQRLATHVVALPLAHQSPLRVSNLRDPQGPQCTFASESFIDEMAASIKADPVAFRVKLLTENIPSGDNATTRSRHVAVVKAAAQAYGWDTRSSPKPKQAGPIVTGRGISYTNRGNPVIATIAEVEVNLETGYVRVKRFVTAHDCGLVVNPEGVRNCVQANLLHSSARTLLEEVTFDTEKVTSVDWISYPILTHLDVPDKIDVVLVNGDPNPTRADLPHYGAGEPSTKPTAAAIANAIFDATGVRMRTIPFTRERVLAELKNAK